MPPKPRPVVERFWPKVEKTETCWLWRGARDPSGYGRFNRGVRGESIALAHRVAYELERGPIPEGLPLDHLCRNPSCVNPAHLEAVPMRENSMRGQHPKYRAHLTGVCLRGHVFAEVGVREYPNGRKGCRQCIRETGRAWVKANPERMEIYKQRTRSG
jgi:hypothetical protein